MPDTGAPHFIPFADPTDLVRDWPALSEDVAEQVALGLDEAGNAGIGSNVVHAVKTNVFTTASDSFVDITGFSVTITPSSATSKVLVIATFRGDRIQASNSGSARTRVVRSGAASPLGDADGSRSTSTGSLGGWIDPGGRGLGSDTIVWLDSPETTSAVTYTGQLARSRAGSAALNRSASDSDGSQVTRGVSEITVIEVAP